MCIEIYIKDKCSPTLYNKIDKKHCFMYLLLVIFINQTW